MKLFDLFYNGICKNNYNFMYILECKPEGKVNHSHKICE